jgi:uncharacterized protein (UPF0335 family)
MTTTPTIYLLERELKNIIGAIEYLNEEKITSMDNLKRIEQSLYDKTTYLKDINKSIEILKHAKSNS